MENKGNFQVLERLLKAKPSGIVAYSLAQFDEERLRRVECPLHFACEGIVADVHTPILMRLKRLLG